MKKIYVILSLLVFSFSSLSLAQDYSSYEQEEFVTDPIPVGPGACGPKPVNPPKGSSWQTCTCKCNTADGDVNVQCWVQIPRDGQPDQKNCNSIFGECSVNGKKGMWRGCTMP